MVKIMIDPGHGNRNVGPRYDSGAAFTRRSAPGVIETVYEADVVLQWALTWKHVLYGAGVPYALTRDDATDPTPVSRRDDQATAARCTHMVSVHVNSSDSPAATGIEVYWRGPEDKPLAEICRASLLHATGLKDRGLKRESMSQHSRLAVLGFPGAGCLIEIGFGSNPKDLEKILLRETRVAFAVDATRRILDRYK